MPYLSVDVTPVQNLIAIFSLKLGYNENSIQAATNSGFQQALILLVSATFVLRTMQ